MGIKILSLSGDQLIIKCVYPHWIIKNYHLTFARNLQT